MASSVQHFGVTVRSVKYGLRMERDTYALTTDLRNSLYPGKLSALESNRAYADETGKFYAPEWTKHYQLLCLENFDLNLRFFASLDHNKFETELSEFLRLYPQFTPVTDLKALTDIPGYYVMVLDEYSQIYIGTTDTGIRQRVQQHWSKRKSLDRLLLPVYNVETSPLSIDSFRALDTTRIFAYPSPSTYDMENEFIQHFSKEFITNRIDGGKFAPGTLGLLQATTSIKTKNLRGIK